MSHMSEEQLVQHYYKDDDNPAGVAAHLAECEDCRLGFARLAETLDSVSTYEVPERSETYGTDVWNQIRAHLPEPEKRSWFSWASARRWVAASAFALLIVTAFLLGRITKPVEPGPTNAQVKSDKDKDRKVLLVALGDHLDRSQMILVELAHTPNSEDVNISSEQERAQDLLASNRLYRQAATRAGDGDLAAVLDELERVLVEVTHEPSKPDGSEMQALQKRIEARGILFKVRVIGSKVRADERRPENETAPTRQPVRQTT